MRKTTQLAIDGRHFDVEAWTRVLEEGFEDPGRRSDAVLHLGTGCEVCGRSLRHLPGRGVALEERTPTSDPVLLALRRWVDGQRDPRKLADLRPMHRFWMERESFEPLDFCRMALEEGRQSAIDRPESATKTFAALLDDVCGDRFLDVWSEGVHDLRCLLHGCLAEAWCAVPDLHEAERHVEAGKRELDMVSGNREILATFYEQQAAFFAVQGLNQKELALLDAASVLLRPDPAPGRRAETLVRKAISLLRRGCGYQAADVLARARASLPVDVCPRLLLEVVHRQALAAVRNREFMDALTYVRRVKNLYSTFPLEPMATQRLWILGVGYLGVDRKDLAEDPLREALKRYSQLQEWDGAAQTLAVLASLYCTEGRLEDLLKLEERFSDVIRSSAARELALAGLRKAIHLSTILDVPVPHLRRTVADLEQETEQARKDKWTRNTQLAGPEAKLVRKAELAQDVELTREERDTSSVN